MRLSFRKFLLFSFFFYTLSAIRYPLSYADTISMRDGKELKGIVVEDYEDRLALSTSDGEINIIKADIRELYFDSEEDNLVKLAELAKDRHDYAKSYAFYSRALKINPDSKAARDGVVAIQGYLYRKEEAMKEYDVNRREEFERYGTLSGSPMAEEKTLEEALGKLESSLGIKLAMKGAMPEIESVRNASSADEAGVKKGDRLVAIWGKLTGYMPLEDVANALLDKPLIEIKWTIDRTVNVSVNSGGLFRSSDGLIGAKLTMEFDGLTAAGVKARGPAAEAGIEKGDLIIAIDGKPTRYMPLKKAIQLIGEASSGGIPMTIRREMLIWRKG